MTRIVRVSGVMEIEHTWVPMRDGVRLSARVWMPEDAATRPVPAILEYIPYRKDDVTAGADASRHPYFAAHGFASVRVDVRGTGSSEGICEGEYTATEFADALDVFAWLEAQPWCTGRCGMIGYSWGGFNGLQVAALAPPQLDAVVTMYSTDDRYGDDCHYAGGCLLASDMLKWAEWMHAINARPPDPRFAGARWREQWLDRLERTPPYIGDWMAHMRRDAFWDHGSVRCDYGAIRAATLVVGGWTDAYTNAVPRLLEHLTCPKSGIIGPWGHVVASHGVPGPAIGLLQECVTWFGRHLRDDEGEAPPLLRVYLCDTEAPATFLAARPGRWVAEDAWPPASVTTQPWGLDEHLRAAAPDAGGAFVPLADTAAARSIVGDQRCGVTAGVWCANGMPDELADDQRADDARSLSFDSEPLEADLTLLGTPVARLTLRVDRPAALVSVRLCAVDEQGRSTLLSWGVRNLARADDDRTTVPLTPGATVSARVPLNAVGERVPAGMRLRLAVSPTYWPQAWPSPEAVTLTLDPTSSVLELPVRSDDASGRPVTFDEPQESAPLAGTISGDARRTRRVTTSDDGATVTITDEQSASGTVSATGTTWTEAGRDEWTITADDPLSATVRCTREVSLLRDDWDVTARTEAVQTCTATDIVTVTSLVATADGAEVFRDSRTFVSPRDGI